MGKKSLKDSFLQLCEDKKFEKNQNQLEVIDLLDKFFNQKKSFSKIFIKSDNPLCFYLYGGVGVGKTMIFNHFYNYLKIPKLRLHFNEFMINFHNFRHLNKDKSIASYVDTLNKNKLIYLDELQVTNIVDAMILGKLFEVIFSKKIKVLITSNTKLEDLYKDGLQRDQFLPFISIIKKNSIHKKLTIDEDYRKLKSNSIKRAFYPICEKTTFKINYLFRELTKGKKKEKVKLDIKGRTFVIKNFYEGIARFDFKELCDTNIGAEDYIKLANVCSFVIIENIPFFSDQNSNQQQRFLTLIDILYEKKIRLMVSLEDELKNIGTSQKLEKSFNRTISRLFELTSSDPNYLKVVK